MVESKPGTASGHLCHHIRRGYLTVNPTQRNAETWTWGWRKAESQRRETLSDNTIWNPWINCSWSASTLGFQFTLAYIFIFCLPMFGLEILSLETEELLANLYEWCCYPYLSHVPILWSHACLISIDHMVTAKPGCEGRVTLTDIPKQNDTGKEKGNAREKVLLSAFWQHWHVEQMLLSNQGASICWSKGCFSTSVPPP